MPLSRRDLLGLGLLGMASALQPIERGWAWTSHVQPPSSPPSDFPFPIVDTHQHLWDLKVLRLPWLSGELERSFLLSDYLEAVRGLPVEKAVYMEVAVVDDDLVKEAEWVIELCHQGQGPTVAAVIGGRPAADNFREYLARFRGEQVVKGVRQNPPASEAGHALFCSPEFRRGLRLLGEWGMSFDICVPPEWLPDAARIAESCPQTPFILDHCGNADPQQFGRLGAKRGPQAKQYVEQWKRGIEAVAERKNVVCKISGIIARVPRDDWGPEDLAPIVNHCLEAFGPDRVMFAGDWPVCTRGAPLGVWIGALREIVASRPPEEQRKLFYANAVRFYGLATQAKHSG